MNIGRDGIKVRTPQQYFTRFQACGQEARDKIPWRVPETDKKRKVSLPMKGFDEQ